MAQYKLKAGGVPYDIDGKDYEEALMLKCDPPAKKFVIDAYKEHYPELVVVEPNNPKKVDLYVYYNDKLVGQIEVGMATKWYGKKQFMYNRWKVPMRKNKWIDSDYSPKTYMLPTLYVAVSADCKSSICCWGDALKPEFIEKDNTEYAGDDDYSYQIPLEYCVDGLFSETEYKPRVGALFI